MENDEQGQGTNPEPGNAQEPEAGTTPAEVSAAADGTQDLAKVRDLVLRANPEVVPELVTGNSIDELIASVEPAKSAYQRIAESVRAGTSAVEPANAEAAAVAAQPPVVPAGGGSNVVDPSTLAPVSKIAQGLAQQRQK